MVNAKVVIRHSQRCALSVSGPIQQALIFPLDLEFLAWQDELSRILSSAFALGTRQLLVSNCHLLRVACLCEKETIIVLNAARKSIRQKLICKNVARQTKALLTAADSRGQPNNGHDRHLGAQSAD